LLLILAVIAGEAIFLKAAFPAFKNVLLGELRVLSPALRISECRAGGSNY
jgi:hypothetical protein